MHRRSADPASALAGARAALEAGQCVGLHPEGAITRQPDHWPARGKRGVVRLALDTGAPVVPLAQSGTHRFVGAEGTDAATPVHLRTGADAVMDALVAPLAVLRGEDRPPHAGRAQPGLGRVARIMTGPT